MATIERKSDEDKLLCAKFLQRALALAGPLKRPKRDWLYSSYHLQGLTYTNTKRNTLERLSCLGLDIVEGKTILDLGSNTGAISFELAKRGAIVFGYEFNEKRVKLCNEIAEFFMLSAEFHQIDLNRGFPSGEYDIVLSLAVDFYVTNPFGFYDKVAAAFKDSAYLEINAHYDRETIQGYFREKKFLAVDYLGDSYSPEERWPVIRKKDIFRLRRIT